MIENLNFLSEGKEVMDEIRKAAGDLEDVLFLLVDVGPVVQAVFHHSLCSLAGANPDGQDLSRGELDSVCEDFHQLVALFFREPMLFLRDRDIGNLAEPDRDGCFLLRAEVQPEEIVVRLFLVHRKAEGSDSILPSGDREEDDVFVFQGRVELHVFVPFDDAFPDVLRKKDVFVQKPPYEGGKGIFVSYFVLVEAVEKGLGPFRWIDHEGEGMGAIGEILVVKVIHDLGGRIQHFLLVLLRNVREYRLAVELLLQSFPLLDLVVVEIADDAVQEIIAIDISVWLEAFKPDHVLKQGVVDKEGEVHLYLVDHVCPPCRILFFILACRCLPAKPWNDFHLESIENGRYFVL